MERLQKKSLRRLIIVILLAGFFLFLYYLNQVEKPELVTTEGRNFEKATVVEILQDNLQENGRRYGEQELRLKMQTGPHKGETVEATSSAGYLFGAGCTPGMQVIAIQSVSGDVTVTSVYSENREWAVYGLILLFFLCICAIGRWQGFKACIGLVFTFICIVFLYLPLIFRGFSPFWAAVLVAICTTLVSMYLVGGPSKKTVCAIGGTVAGVIIAGAIATLFGHFAGISGYNVSDIESLLFIEDSTGIQVGGLLFSGLLIASLGAVMDVAISIASTIEEVHNRRPTLSRMELFQSGMHVGRDTMGTMSTTLILAFAGSSISMLVSYYVYDLPFIQIINSYGMGIEIMQGISGSMGIILTVPLVSAATAFLMGSPRSAVAQTEGGAPNPALPADAPAVDSEIDDTPEQESSDNAQAAPGKNLLQLTGIQQAFNSLVRRSAEQENPAWQRVLAGLQARWQLVVTVLCLLVLTFCALRLFGPLSVSAAGQSDYRAVESAVTKSEDASSAVVTDTALQSEKAFSLDYQKLAAQNADALGWLRLPGTALSYPVVQGKDNDYYLAHTFSKSENPAGAVFLDSRTDGGLSSQHSILYGHNMHDGTMFAALNKFRKQDFYLEHPKLELYNESEKQEYLIFSAYECEPDSDSYTRDFADKTVYNKFLNQLKKHSLYDTGVSVNPDLPLLTLSTCVDDNDRDVRFVVHAQPEKSV